MLFYKTIAQKKAKADKENKPPYASPTLRMVASLIDVIISSVILIPVYYVLNTILFGDMPNKELAEHILLQRNPELLARLLTSSVIQLAILMLLVLIYWIKSNSTPGKQMLRLKIVDSVTLQTPTRMQYVRRLIGYVISSIPLGLGFVWMGISRKKQGWHDLIAHTVVVSVRNPKKTTQNAE